LVIKKINMFCFNNLQKSTAQLKTRHLLNFQSSININFLLLFKLTLIVILMPFAVNAQDNNSELKATYLYADSIPEIDTTTIENKSISKFKGNKKSPKKKTTKKDSRPFMQRVIRPEKHSPLTATAFSLALPGAGQVYNKKYWKLPIIYGGLGWMGYRIYKTTQDHREFRGAYLSRIDDDPETIDGYPLYSADNLNTLRLATKKDQELAIIGFSFVYILVAVDAFVDAHLLTFDVNDDLSMGVSPTVLLTDNQSFAPGISLNLYLTPRLSPILFSP